MTKREKAKHGVIFPASQRSIFMGTVIGNLTLRTLTR